MAQHAIKACLAACYPWGFSLLLSGCLYMPSKLEVEIADTTPMQGTTTDIQTLALALPSTIETLTGVSDPSRGKLDPIALEFAERLPRTGRVSLVPMSEYHAALSKSRPPDFRAGSSMSDDQLKEFLLRAALAVKADAVILLHGSWDSPINLGRTQDIRGEYKRQVRMSLIAAKTKETLWSQQATVTVVEGRPLPHEEDIRSPVVSRLVQNLMDTLH